MTRETRIERRYRLKLMIHFRRMGAMDLLRRAQRAAAAWRAANYIG
jgi:hypothetical protein